jgi:hypothetical protein
MSDRGNQSLWPGDLSGMPGALRESRLPGAAVARPLPCVGLGDAERVFCRSCSWAAGLLLLGAWPARAQTNGQIWGNITVKWVQGEHLTHELDVEPKVLVSAPEGEPERRNVDVTPNLEIATASWLDLITEIGTATRVRPTTRTQPSSRRASASGCIAGTGSSSTVRFRNRLEFLVSAALPTSANAAERAADVGRRRAVSHERLRVVHPARRSLGACARSRLRIAVSSLSSPAGTPRDQPRLAPSAPAAPRPSSATLAAAAATPRGPWG